MNLTNELYICSASVLSYEQRGKETWYHILSIPRHDPCYIVHRRYQDFVHLSNQLGVLFPHYASKKKSTSCFPCRVKPDPRVSPPQQQPSVFTSKSLPRLSSPILFATSSTLSFSSFSSSTSVQAPVSRQKRQKQLDRYLYNLFKMPPEVHQSACLFNFLNFRPLQVFPLPHSLQKSKEKRLSTITTTRLTLSVTNETEVTASVMSLELPSPSSEIRPSPSISCSLFPRRYSKPLPPTPTGSCSESTISIITPTSSLVNPVRQRKLPNSRRSISVTQLLDKGNKDQRAQVPSSFSPLPITSSLLQVSPLQLPSLSSLASPESPSAFSRPFSLSRLSSPSSPESPSFSMPLSASVPASASVSKGITISLYLGAGSFVSTFFIRKQLSLELLLCRLNQCLYDQGLDSLPATSVLAYNHIASSDRQGALETLTLNQKEPWVEYDNVMTLASSLRIAFFASTLPSGPTTMTRIRRKLDQPSSDTQRRHCEKDPVSDIDENEDDDTKGKVLLIATERDLQAAINGKWRRLDQVTLSCLAW